MSRNRQHFIIKPDGCWAVKKEGSSRATKVFGTQREVVLHGQAIAQKQMGELYIHGSDGRVLKKNSYSTPSGLI